MRWRGGLFSKRVYDLWVAGRKRTKLVDGLERQIRVVRTALERSDLAHVPVEGALCLSNVDGLPLLRRLSMRGLLIGGPKRVAKLAGRPGPLGADEVATVHSALATSLKPA